MYPCGVLYDVYAAEHPSLSPLKGRVHIILIYTVEHEIVYSSAIQYYYHSIISHQLRFNQKAKKYLIVSVITA
jgi:hypothetical protein